MSIAREAWPFALPPALAAIVCWALGQPLAAVLLAAATLCVAAFFRIPARRFAGGERAVLAPANGVVTAVDRVEEPEIGPGTFQRVVTFLSVFNVHVQRAPVDGAVVLSRFRRGRKVAAFRDDAGEVNESHLLVLERAAGGRVGVRQIAGLLARRVVCHARVGDALERGELFGLIKFGSRVDLYLPADWTVAVEKGQRLTEGVSVVAEAP